MTHNLRLALLPIAALAGLALPTLPAQAGPEEIALLQTYIGEWSGRGRLSGAADEAVVCRIGFTAGNQGRLNYSGRCALAGSNLSVNGTIAYIDASQRYEAIMTSNTQFTGVAIGRESEGGLLFNLQDRDATEGQDLSIEASMLLLPQALAAEFTIVRNDTGETINAQVPFTR